VLVTKLFQKSKLTPLASQIQNKFYGHHASSTTSEPDQDLRHQISLYFVDVLGGCWIDYVANLPLRMAIWGKLQIQGGDLLRTSWAWKWVKSSVEYGDNCYV
jgi:hypothetical protein